MSQRGSLRKRGDTWTAYWTVQEGGKRRQRSKGGFPTKRDASAHLTEQLSLVARGEYVEPSKLTVERLLVEDWLPSLDRRPSTLSIYRTAVVSWIVPSLGQVRLDALTPADVQRMITRLRDGGGRYGQPLSARSVQVAYVVLRAALDYAARQRLAVRNVAAAVDRPRATSPEMHAWTAGEVAAFLDHVEDDRLSALWTLLLARGLRRGEALGLRWQDVDLDAGRLRIVVTRLVVADGQGWRVVAGTPKTSAGRRTVPLDVELVRVLRRHRAQQAQERLAWGEGWTDSGHVFTREDGQPLHPDWTSDAWGRQVRTSGLPPIRLHDARHTCATLALEAGIPTEVVSRWLGHASVAITWATYQHVRPQLLEEAGATLTALMTAGRRTRPTDLR